MKLGVTYSVFSGEELLRASILSIRKCVDYINVVYQEVSWTGIRMNPELPRLLNTLKEEGLIDNIILYQIKQVKGNAKWAHIETCRKKNKGLRDLKKNHCTHCIIMDTDEFYRVHELEEAKKIIEEMHITHSCCNIYDYKISPCYRQIEANHYAVPFILKLRKFSFISGFSNIPCKVDTLRVYPMMPIRDKFYYFTEVSMHHMTGVRREINSKLDNTITNYLPDGESIITKYKTDYEEIKLAQFNMDELNSLGFIITKNEFGIEI